MQTWLTTAGTDEADVEPQAQPPADHRKEIQEVERQLAWKGDFCSGGIPSVLK